ncbi:MAG: hypothetical protein AB3N13_10920 [Arenibacterium sp.]
MSKTENIFFQILEGIMVTESEQGDNNSKPHVVSPKTDGEPPENEAEQSTKDEAEQATENSQELVKKPDPGIGELVEKARILLFHGIEQGNDIEKEHIDAVTEAMNAYGTDDWTLDLEKRFYSAYSAMSKLSGGVSAAAIEHTRSFRLIYTFVIAAIGIAFLAYLVYQQNTFVRLQESTSAYDKLTEQRRLKDRDLRQKESERANLETFNRLPPTVPTKIAGPVAFGLTLDPEESPIQRESRISAEVDALKFEIARIENQINAQFRIISEIMPVSSADPVPEQPSGGWIFGADEAEMDAWRASVAAWEARQQTRAVTDDFYGVQRAKTQIIFFNSYFLPALYGLLGTAAFVLRAFSRELRSLTLQPVNLLNYLIRLPLGALSGIAVGLILIPDGTVQNGDAVAAAPEIAGLTTVALAFIAGYSVELLFTAMDRIVSAFGGGQTS